MNDGVSLTSAAHPRAPWYERVWFWLRRPELNPNNLESIEVTVAGIWNDSVLRALYLNLYPQYNRTTMNDNEIEKEIQTKGLTEPRVTLEHVESTVAYEYYITGSEIHEVTTAVLGPAHARHSDPALALLPLTLCVLVLKNGFTVTGESACVSPENFDEALGRKIARQKAIDKVWMLEGYLLKERLHRDAINRSSGSGDFGDS